GAGPALGTGQDDRGGFHTTPGPAPTRRGPDGQLAALPAPQGARAEPRPRLPEARRPAAGRRVRRRQRQSLGAAPVRLRDLEEAGGRERVQRAGPAGAPPEPVAARPLLG